MTTVLSKCLIRRVKAAGVSFGPLMRRARGKGKDTGGKWRQQKKRETQHEMCGRSQGSQGSHFARSEQSYQQ